MFRFIRKQSYSYADCQRYCNCVVKRSVDNTLQMNKFQTISQISNKFSFHKIRIFSTLRKLKRFSLQITPSAQNLEEFDNKYHRSHLSLIIFKAFQKSVVDFTRTIEVTSLKTKHFFQET